MLNTTEIARIILWVFLTKVDNSLKFLSCRKLYADKIRLMREGLTEIYNR